LNKRVEYREKAEARLPQSGRNIRRYLGWIRKQKPGLKTLASATVKRDFVVFLAEAVFGRPEVF